MSKFNSYARELDSLVKQLRDEYTKRLEAYNAARKPVIAHKIKTATKAVFLY